MSLPRAKESDGDRSEATDLVRRLLHEVKRGRLHAPKRLIRLLEATAAALKP